VAGGRPRGGDPLDQSDADVLCAMSSIEIMKYPDSVVPCAHHEPPGRELDVPPRRLRARTSACCPAMRLAQKLLTMKIIDAAVACGAKTVILPECGPRLHALRWMGANMYGQPLPFRVMHIAEFLAEQVREGKLRLKKVAKTATFHDPCQVVRRGGAIEHRARC